MYGVGSGLCVSTVLGTSDLPDSPVVILTDDRELDDAASTARFLRPCFLHCDEL